MPAAIMPWVRQQFFDANGAPLASGDLQFFDSGTATARAVFSDADLTTSAGTTVTLNSAGFPTVSGSEVALYLSPVAYRVIVRNSAGTTLRTVDGVYALQAASSTNLDISNAVAGEALSAGDLCYLSDGSNSLTAGRWYRADADLYYASIHPELGFATAAIASGATGTIRIGGVITGLSGLTAGSTYYVSTTAAALTATAPMNARSVGVAISTTTVLIDFGPQWIANSDPLSICDGRLTLTTAVPVTTANVTGATTMYFTPFRGNRVALFDGSKWKVYPFTEVSLALGTLTSGLPYDVYLYDNAGTLTLEFTAWTDDITQATALVLQNGVRVRSGATTRRYLGIFYTTSTTATEDSLTRRLLWNYYNRQPRPMRVTEATDTWTYTTASYRQANASTANQLELVVGVLEDPIELQVVAYGRNGIAAKDRSVGIGEDSTTAVMTGVIGRQGNHVGIAEFDMMQAVYKGFPGSIGQHIYAWLEISEAADTTTWAGDNGTPTTRQSGMDGIVWG